MALYSRLFILSIFWVSQRAVVAHPYRSRYGYHLTSTITETATSVITITVPTTIIKTQAIPIPITWTERDPEDAKSRRRIGQKQAHTHVVTKALTEVSTLPPIISTTTSTETCTETVTSWSERASVSVSTLTLTATVFKPTTVTRTLTLIVLDPQMTTTTVTATRTLALTSTTTVVSLHTVISVRERTRTLVSRSTATVTVTLTTTIVTPIILLEPVTREVTVPTTITKTAWYQVATTLTATNWYPMATTITTTVLPAARSAAPAKPSALPGGERVDRGRAPAPGAIPTSAHWPGPSQVTSNNIGIVSTDGIIFHLEQFMDSLPFN